MLTLPDATVIIAVIGLISVAIYRSQGTRYVSDIACKERMDHLGREANSSVNVMSVHLEAMQKELVEIKNRITELEKVRKELEEIKNILLRVTISSKN